MKHVAVVGLGYVGLPLALLAAEKGYKVTGIDIDEARVNSLNSGKSYIDDISEARLKKTSAAFTTDITTIKDAQAVIVCVPTPVTKEKQPDLRPVEGAIKAITPHLQKQSLVVLESTVNPGVCDEIVIPLLEAGSGIKVGRDVYLAHCPERINPGDPNWDVSNINRVVGANSQKELDLALELYRSLIDAEVKPMASLKEAEAVKVVENSFRDINIAFVNELAMSFHKLGINLENVIDGAATKPFAFMAHRPGCGVGGHCIPIDPYYLIEYAGGYGFNHEFLRLARTINDNMPNFTFELLESALNELKKPVKDTKISLLGLSYKPNVGDDRESPAYEIKQLLEDAGADLKTFDPYITAGSSAGSLNEALEHADAIVITTGHKAFKDALTPELIKSSGVKVVIDGRNILRGEKKAFEQARILYKGIGV